MDKKPEQIKYICGKEFRERGYLQEVNRQFLHPLGLALENVLLPDGREVVGGLLDYRGQAGGVAFERGIIDADAIKNIDKLQKARGRIRKEVLGFIVQPQEYIILASPLAGKP